MVAGLCAIADRGLHPPFLLDLETTFQRWNETLNNDDPLRSHIHAVLPSLHRCRRVLQDGLGEELFPSASPKSSSRRDRTGEQEHWPQIPSEEVAAEIGVLLGLDQDESALMTKMFSKMVALKTWDIARAKGVADGIDEEAQDQGRSVRTL
jgi:hypothetical protein